MNQMNMNRDLTLLMYLKAPQDQLIKRYLPKKIVNLLHVESMSVQVDCMCSSLLYEAVLSNIPLQLLHLRAKDCCPPPD